MCPLSGHALHPWAEGTLWQPEDHGILWMCSVWPVFCCYYCCWVRCPNLKLDRCTWSRFFTFLEKKKGRPGNTDVVFSNGNITWVWVETLAAHGTTISHCLTPPQFRSRLEPAWAPRTFELLVMCSFGLSNLSSPTGKCLWHLQGCLPGFIFNAMVEDLCRAACSFSGKDPEE